MQKGIIQKVKSIVNIKKYFLHDLQEEEESKVVEIFSEIDQDYEDKNE